MIRKPIRPNLEVADQPTVDDLKALKDEGFSAVVNLRREGEPEQPIDPKAEGDHARQLGLEYLNIPVGGEPLEESQVKAVHSFLERHSNGKVLVHCRKGGRAAAMTLLHIAEAENWKADEAIEKGNAIGLELPPKLRDSVLSYLNR